MALPEVPLATPLAAYIRVPLSWYHSTTYAFFPDETHAMIRRSYTHPSQQSSKRHFCGFCGTPLSYWCEDPMSEADYINLTLGSLLREDLRDLEDMGLIPDDSDPEEDESAEAPTADSGSLREYFGVPWFDGMVEGTKLGKLRRRQGVGQSHDGSVKVEWEIVEYSDDGKGDAGEDVDMDAASSASGKRKMHEREH